MRAEFFRRDDPKAVVGTALWEARLVRVHSDDPGVHEALQRVFRPTPVAVDDPTLRDPAAGGVSVVEPGDLHWFRTAAVVRGPREDLGVRFVTETPGGWDPAGAYRPLEAWVDIREGGGEPRTLGTSRA
jgi:hypothetical protein